ncbi:hypothetical protein GX645_03885 [Candidatus Sumerlaeota bacterium]|nr:hypothetical protein [Candidatus Sumerlaeales bacterium]NLD61575.1 hypothetical protein [Candidatus Sumerlaeota bacterium]
MIRRCWMWLKSLITGEKEFLCDTCRYDYDKACNRRERPNATKCKDYKRN